LAVPTDPIDAWASLAHKESFAVVGLGGAGGDAVRDLVELGVPNVHAFAVNTDAKHLLTLPIEERILLGQRRLKGRGSGGDRGAVLEAAEDAKEEIVRRLAKFEIVFLLAGLGGGTGSALLPFFTEALRKTDALAVPVVFLPFQVELESNPDRRRNVDETLAELEEMGGLLLALSNEKLRRFESLPLHRAFLVRNTFLHRLVTSLVDMIEHPSQLNVDLASLRTHLADAGLSTLLHGEYHVSEPELLVHQALTESLLDFTIPDGASAIVHLDGGANLTLQLIHRVLDALRDRLANPRRLILGTRYTPERRDVVRLTAIVGGLKPRTIRDAVGTPIPRRPAAIAARP
jgi:cell division protein FtsZ